VIVRGIKLDNNSKKLFNKHPTKCCDRQLDDYMNFCPVCGTDVSHTSVPTNNTNGDLSLFVNSQNQTIIGFAIAVMDADLPNRDTFFVNDINDLRSINYNYPNEIYMIFNSLK
jgi:hypothetical protein